MPKGFLGIDAGTQGLAVVLVDEQLKLVATGDGHYDMVPGLDEGCYEQHPADWVAALETAMGDLRGKLKSQGDGELEILAIGISGQMHGEVLADAEGNSLGPARLWCDARNADEGDELTEQLGVKMPKRITAARWLWTTRNRPELAKKTAHITTPAGWLAYCLTGEWNLGVGDASGMFPIDAASLNYDVGKLQQVDGITGDKFPALSKLLPSVRKAGEDGGSLNGEGAKLLGLPEGIPVAPAEGDQPAALAGSLIAEAGMVSVSFGTSVCANAVGDKPFKGVSQAVDHFCAVDGKPINMVFLRNGTTFMNTVVQMFVDSSGKDFGELMQQVLTAEPDCGGVLAIPFMDDEPGLGVEQGGNASLVGINQNNATAGNCIRAAMTATMMNLKSGSGILDEQGYPRTEVILTGGLTRTPELGQVLADIMQTPVSLPAGSDEGTALGAALLAGFRYQRITKPDVETTWTSFVQDMRRTGFAEVARFESDSSTVKVYDAWRSNYSKLVHPESQQTAATA